MTTSLQSALNDLAESFAQRVLDALRGASLNELFETNGQARLDLGRSTRASTTAAAPQPKKVATGKSRLPRRSLEEIAEALGQVVALVKKHKEGLRAEQIRSELGLQAKELPRVLKEGLAKRALKSKGQKRATTYFAG
ncbi:MAG: hypothetical protein ABSC94_18335 [Polyangiaceae bacterium]|jgi:hypothetical protein